VALGRAVGALELLLSVVAPPELPELLDAPELLDPPALEPLDAPEPPDPLEPLDPLDSPELLDPPAPLELPELPELEPPLELEPLLPPSAAEPDGVPPEPPLSLPPTVEPPPCPPVPGSPVGGTGATVGAWVGGVVVPVAGVDELADGFGVVADSSGWLVVALGEGRLAGVGLVAAFLVTVADSSRDDA
jgi:hypothetical protein